MSDTQEIVGTARADVPSAPWAPRRTGGRLRHALARTDPAVVPLALGSLLLCAAFVAVSLAYNQGRLIPPLDDVYIHLQYGRQMGLGQPFRYQPGEPVTSGASSPLYALLLGAAWFAGFRDHLLLFAVGFGALCAAATTVLTCLTGRRLGGVAVGRWAGALVCLCGPLLWGAVSGMEVGLLAALLAGSLHAFVCEQPSGRFRATPLLAALLALTRPEGLVVALGLAAGMVWTVVRTTRADRRPRGPAAGRVVVAVLPLLVGLLPSVFFLVTTGTAEANGVAAKSWLNQGLLLQPLEVADQTLRNVREVAATLTGLSGQDVAPPGTLVFAVLGIVALAFGRPGRRTVAAVLAFGLGAVLLSVSTLSTAQWQDLRYLQPFLPTLLLTAVLGVDAATRRGGGRHHAVALHGLLAVALLFTVIATPTWALRLGQQASAMRDGPVTIADWIHRTVPPGDSVAVNDVGAAAWFGGHRTVDLVGLTTNGMAAPALNGSGTMYSALRDMPPDRRPDWFVIFDRWAGVPVGELSRSRVLGPRPVQTFQLTGPARPISPTAPQTCQIDRSCDHVDAWRADWSLAGSGNLPDRPVPGAIRDHVDVGDLGDEARHDWSTQPPVLGRQPVSTVDAGAVAPGREVVDSGRRIAGGETFTVDGLTPGRAAALTGRLSAGDARTGANDVEVRVNGVPVAPWALPERPPGTWAQATFVVPAERVTSSRITVSITPRREFLGPYPDYTSYGWWISQ